MLRVIRGRLSDADVLRLSFLEYLQDVIFLCPMDFTYVTCVLCLGKDMVLVLLEE